METKVLQSIQVEHEEIHEQLAKAIKVEARRAKPRAPS